METKGESVITVLHTTVKKKKSSMQEIYTARIQAVETANIVYPQL
jgi:hypothetical protein